MLRNRLSTGNAGELESSLPFLRSDSSCGRKSIEYLSLCAVLIVTTRLCRKNKELRYDAKGEKDQSVAAWDAALIEANGLDS